MGRRGRQTSIMKAPNIVIGLIACGFLSGCAHDQTKSTDGEPVNGTVGSPTPAFSVSAASNGAPFYYQWHMNGTNIGGTTNQ